MEVQYAIESLDATKDEIKPLAALQWEELKYAPLDEEEFNPDIEGLLTMEQIGSLLVITARDEGELVGYLILLCSEMINHKGSYMAAENAMYVDPAYRRAGIAQSIVKHAVAVCKNNGVKYLSFTVTPKLNYSPLLESLEFEQTEVVYTKRI
jgi:GNAT superfamily N-acetyltransferase